MRAFLIRFLAARSGATAIEYGLIVALLAIGIVGALIAVGGRLSGSLTQISSHFP